jgi:hypothetical protein
MLAPHVFQQHHDLVAGVFIQVAGGLVGEEDSWSLDEGARDRDPLLLAAGQLGRQVPGPLAQTDLGQRLQGAFLPLRCVHAERDERGLDIFRGGQGGDEVEGLEDEADRCGANLGELTFPSAGPVLAGQLHGA